MTRIVVHGMQPKKYNPNQIHALVCQHEAEWRKLPALEFMAHKRDSSAVSVLAWRYHIGEPLDLIVQAQHRPLGHTSRQLTVETLQALGRILGVEPVKPSYTPAASTSLRSKPEQQILT